MSSMHNHQTALRDRAEGLTTAFNDVQEQVRGLQAGIAEFATTQNETMSGFKMEMEAAKALATAFGKSISSLNIIGISTILDSFWALSQGVGLVVVVAFVNWLAGKTAARIVAITCEYLSGALCGFMLTQIHQVSGSSLSISPADWTCKSLSKVCLVLYLRI